MRRLVVDLVDASLDIPTNLRKRGGDWWSWWWPFPRPAKKGTYDKVPIVGTVFDYSYFVRNAEDPRFGSESLALPQDFLNGTVIPPGQYKLLVRVLKITGDPHKQEDYETYLSPQIGVVPA